MELACSAFRSPVALKVAFGPHELFRYTASPRYQLLGMSQVNNLNSTVLLASPLPPVSQQNLPVAAYSVHGTGGQHTLGMYADIGTLPSLPSHIEIGGVPAAVKYISNSHAYQTISPASVATSHAHTSRSPPFLLRDAVGPAFR